MELRDCDICAFIYDGKPDESVDQCVNCGRFACDWHGKEVHSRKWAGAFVCNSCTD